MPELLALPVSFGLPVAAKALNIGKNKAYEMVAEGTFPIPVHRYGREYRAHRPDLFRHLGLPPDMVSDEARGVA
jgi:excisionase family DNA binding protein